MLAAGHDGTCCIRVRRGGWIKVKTSMYLDFELKAHSAQDAPLLCSRGSHGSYFIAMSRLLCRENPSAGIFCKTMLENSRKVVLRRRLLGNLFPLAGCTEVTICEDSCVQGTFARSYPQW